MVNAVPERHQTIKPKARRILIIFTAVLTLLPPQEQTAQVAECIFAFFRKAMPHDSQLPSILNPEPQKTRNGWQAIPRLFLYSLTAEPSHPPM